MHADVGADEVDDRGGVLSTVAVEISLFQRLSLAKGTKAIQRCSLAGSHGAARAWTESLRHRRCLHHLQTRRCAAGGSERSARCGRASSAACQQQKQSCREKNRAARKSYLQEVPSTSFSRFRVDSPSWNQDLWVSIRDMYGGAARDWSRRTGGKWPWKKDEESRGLICLTLATNFANIMTYYATNFHCFSCGCRCVRSRRFHTRSA